MSEIVYTYIYIIVEYRNSFHTVLCRMYDINFNNLYFPKEPSIPGYYEHSGCNIHEFSESSCKIPDYDNIVSNCKRLHKLDKSSQKFIDKKNNFYKDYYKKNNREFIKKNIFVPNKLLYHGGKCCIDMRNDDKQFLHLITPDVFSLTRAMTITTNNKNDFYDWDKELNKDLESNFY